MSRALRTIIFHSHKRSQVVFLTRSRMPLKNPGRTFPSQSFRWRSATIPGVAAGCPGCQACRGVFSAPDR